MANHSMPEYNPFSFCQIVKACCNNDFTAQEKYVDKIHKESKLEKIRSLDIADYDYCVIAFGHNDRSNGVKLGNPDSRNCDEFYGALNVSIEMLLNKYPHLRLILIAPYDRPSATPDKPMLKYVEAIEEVGSKYSIPVINLYKISGINRITEKVHLEDGLHPKNKSKYGYEYIGNIIGAQLITYI